MKQTFSKKQHEVFKKYANIKNTPWKWDEKYLSKTASYLKYLKWIPGVAMIWVWNSISMNASRESSDIDLYVVTSNSSMWFVRILLTLIFQILWVRKNEKKHSWRFCLSFFSTKKWMDFSSFAIENDIYLYFWIVYFKPILSYNHTYEDFIKINNSWADFSEYNYIIEENKKSIIYHNSKNPLNPPYQEEVDQKQKRTWFVITYINNLLKKIFLQRTIKTHEKLGKPFWVIINDDMLKFHNNDIRKKISKNIWL